MRALLRHSLAMLSNPRLIALHLVGNAVLLTCASFWLLIPEEHVWQLLAAGASAALLIFGFLWIHSGTLVYAAEPVREKFYIAFRPRIGRLAWLALGLLALFWLMGIVDGWSNSEYQISGYIYSKTPSWLHLTSGDFVYVRYLDYLFSIAYWYLLPCLFLPVIAARVAGVGALRGLRALRRWQYWVAMAVLALAGVWLTHTILGWTPGHGLRAETVSLVVRLLLAYAIATAAWLMTVGVLGHFVESGNGADSLPIGAWWKRIFPRGGEGRAIVNRCLVVVSDRRLVVLQVIALVVAAVDAVISTNTLVDFEHIWWMVAAAIAGLLLLAGFLWVYSSTLAYAADPNPTKFRDAFRFRFRPMLWLFLGMLALILLAAGSEDLLWRLNTNDRHFGLILHLTNMTSGYVLPCLILPWVAVKTAGGRLPEGLDLLRRWRYWAGMAAIVFVAGWLSDQLSAVYVETDLLWSHVHAVIRAVLVSLPLVVGWVAAAGLLGCFVSSSGNQSAADVLRQPAS